ncbi:hypothetical protein EDB83DRAFT_407184 [Lactarius deliciosus]|nr:hypothetical protein EDB83DRAFT_407184 [Lactarius deliciosus]
MTDNPDHPLCYQRVHFGLIRCGHHHQCRHFGLPGAAECPHPVHLVHVIRGIQHPEHYRATAGSSDVGGPTAAWTRPHTHTSTFPLIKRYVLRRRRSRSVRKRAIADARDAGQSDLERRSRSGGDRKTRAPQRLQTQLQGTMERGPITTCAGLPCEGKHVFHQACVNSDPRLVRSVDTVRYRSSCIFLKFSIRFPSAGDGALRISRLTAAARYLRFARRRHQHRMEQDLTDLPLQLAQCSVPARARTRRLAGVPARLGTRCDYVCVGSFYHTLYYPFVFVPCIGFLNSFVIYVVCMTKVA